MGFERGKLVRAERAAGVEAVADLLQVAVAVAGSASCGMQQTEHGCQQGDECKFLFQNNDLCRL